MASAVPSRRTSTLVGVRILDYYFRSRRRRLPLHDWHLRGVNERLAFVGIAIPGFVDTLLRSRVTLSRAGAYTYLDYKGI